MKRFTVSGHADNVGRRDLYRRVAWLSSGAEIELASPIGFTVPASIPVKLRFWGGQPRDVTCKYQGDGHAAFTLRQCSHGLAAGSRVSAKEFQLSVHGGDRRHPDVAVDQQGRAVVVWGWFSHEVIAGNRSQFNVYYVPEEVPTDNFIRASFDLPFTPQDQHPSFNATVEFKPQGTTGAKGSIVFIDANIPADILPATFTHELAHAVFNLADEYDCSDPERRVRFESPRHPNIFSTEARCKEFSVGPKLVSARPCLQIQNTAGLCNPDNEKDGWWKSEPSDFNTVNDIMNENRSGRPFGPDCQKNIRLLFQEPHR
jgi:hypothetical protein